MLLQRIFLCRNKHEKTAQERFPECHKRRRDIGCVAGDDALVLIDLPQDPMETSAWRDALRAEFGDRPIRAILYTSSDRLNSESLAVINATAVLHDAAYAQLAQPQESPALQMLEPMTMPLIRELGSTPQLTFNQSSSVIVGSKQPAYIDIMHQGGYSSDACFVIVRDAGIAFVGDHVAIGQPPVLAQGDFEHWQAVLANLKKMKNLTMVVPGRGPASVPATAGDETNEFIKAATSKVKALVRSNRSRSDVGALVPESWRPTPGKAQKQTATPMPCNAMCAPALSVSTTI